MPERSGSAPPDAGVAVAVAPDAATGTSRPDDRPAPEPSPRRRRLQIAVTSLPAGASVIHDGRTIGKTPLTSAFPCGPAKIAINYRRYERVDKAISPRPGAPSSVDVRLERPIRKVTFRSRPPGATITVDGRSVGTAPVTTRVRAFTSVEVRAELAGYQPWSQKIYLEARADRITGDAEEEARQAWYLDRMIRAPPSSTRARSPRPAARSARSRGGGRAARMVPGRHAATAGALQLGALGIDLMRASPRPPRRPCSGPAGPGGDRDPARDDHDARTHAHAAAQPARASVHRHRRRVVLRGPARPDRRGRADRDPDPGRVPGTRSWPPRRRPA
jgi:hypothetical protein